MRGQVAAMEARSNGQVPLVAGAFLWAPSDAIHHALNALDSDQAEWAEAIIALLGGRGLGLAPLLHRFFGMGLEPCYTWSERKWLERTFGPKAPDPATIFRSELRRRPNWIKEHRGELRAWLPVVKAIAQVNEARIG
jgi:hypothetical protein